MRHQVVILYCTVYVKGHWTWVVLIDHVRWAGNISDGIGTTFFMYCRFINLLVVNWVELKSVSAALSVSAGKGTPAVVTGMLKMETY